MPASHGCAVIFMFLLSQAAFAQSAPANDSSVQLWLRLGLGGAGNRDYHGFGGTLGAQYNSSVGLLGIRYVGSGSATMEPMTIGVSRLAEVSEVSATYGIFARLLVFDLSASTGLGVVWGRIGKVGGDEDYATLALPVEGEVAVRLLPVLALGGMVSSAINSRKPVTNAMIVIHLGKLQ
jgi:hypothetical protein